MSQETRQYAVVYEGSDQEGWSAYVLDLPGCTSAAETFQEIQTEIQEAICDHIEILRETGHPVPEPKTQVGLIGVRLSA